MLNLIGKNSIVCGDCRQIMKDLEEGSFDAVVTDPPYGVTKDLDDYIATEFLEEAYRVIKEDGALMMLVGQATLREFWNAAEAAGFKWLNTIVWWHRNSLSRQTKKFSVQYDPILYMSKGDFVHRTDAVRIEYRSKERLKYPCNNKKSTGWMPNPLGAMCPDVWEIPAVTTTSPNGNDFPVGHKWQKPKEVFSRMIRATTLPGGMILDPYCGSGTSLIAARDNGVDFVGIEIDPNNVNLCENRLSGKIAPTSRKTAVKAKSMTYFEKLEELGDSDARD